MIRFLKNLILKYGFGGKPETAHFGYSNNPWGQSDFFSAYKAKTERLAAIARERTALKERLAVAIKQKKARAPIYQALRALSVEELNLEAGK